MDETGIFRDIAVLVLGVASGAIPWLLDRLGIEMPRPVYICLLLVSAACIGWALINLGWIDRIPGLRNKQVSLSSSLICICVSAVAVFVLVTMWGKTSPDSVFHYSDSPAAIEIKGRNFLNERVPLDGRHYSFCTFTNATFVYNGTTGIEFDNNTINGLPMLYTDNPAVINTGVLLKGIGFMKPNVPLVAGPTQKPILSEAPH